MHFRKGQSIVEYTLMLCVILSAILIMQVYVKRAYQGRLKQESDNVGQQYSPKHTSSSISNTGTVKTYSYTGGTDPVTGATIPDGVSLTRTTTNNTMQRKEAVDSFAAD
jgi:cytoskeletal protein RodZ